MRSSRPLRRLLGVSACIAALLLGTTGAPAAERSRLLDGDRGSGPTLPAPHSAQRTDGVKWSDVPKAHWARAAVDFVGATNEWMRDFPQADDGTYPFKPDAIESRALFARSLVRAFAPAVEPDPDLRFEDLATDDRFFPFANVAVTLGWMQVDADGNFLPEEPVTVRSAHGALVPAMGLGDLAEGADGLHLRDGTKVPTPPGFGALLVGMRAGLRYNHSDESLDVGPDSPLPRAEVAWSLYRAATVPTWTHDYLGGYADFELPNLNASMQRVVAFGVRYVGYPYVWGGEWAEPTPDGYCCGAQPVGGFDCSGFTWWVMKQSVPGWDNTPPREYRGWVLPQRSSAEMAANGDRVRKFDDLRPGDLVFYDGDGDGTVDHVDTYIGSGWSLDSGSSNGGVTITRIAGTWYEEHFVRGRHLTG
jgi:hypothetical protein